MSSLHASWSYVKAEDANFRLVWWRRASLCCWRWHFRTIAEIAGCLSFLSVCLLLRGYNSAISPHLACFLHQLSPITIHCFGPMLSKRIFDLLVAKEQSKSPKVRCEWSFGVVTPCRYLYIFPLPQTAKGSLWSISISPSVHLLSQSVTVCLSICLIMLSVWCNLRLDKWLSSRDLSLLLFCCFHITN